MHRIMDTEIQIAWVPLAFSWIETKIYELKIKFSYYMNASLLL
jgi:hypothetical protein